MEKKKTEEQIWLTKLREGCKQELERYEKKQDSRIRRVPEEINLKSLGRLLEGQIGRYKRKTSSRSQKASGGLQ